MSKQGNQLKDMIHACLDSAKQTQRALENYIIPSTGFMEAKSKKELMPTLLLLLERNQAISTQMLTTISGYLTSQNLRTMQVVKKSNVKLCHR